ncbi:hypothetical protein CLAVI_000939 [Candidatus Clavichlamydia salmonicola]|uniref:hypothetical protein n=1 Tax=Candidatus Clavichlamydia salmonicola TaxID=469812 RepID=UPI0018912224|nr:hypothetical protein [Candidatus Clavichlamydia salmonicola]MBF5051298.1 hypothetical protein [Candidatus Clavichlamydia salmonicola]
MSGIGNGFSSGIQLLNDKLFVHTGRSCPSSWKELKDNVSKNAKTCAKICTAFLDSSFGLAVAMGVVGVVTTSLCAGEDMIDVVSTTLFPSITTITTTTMTAPTLSPLPNNELVYLCASGRHSPLGLGKIAERNWSIGQFGVGQEDADKLSHYDVWCFSLQEYRNQYPNTSAPDCQATDWSTYPNYNASHRYFSYVYTEVTASKPELHLSTFKDCMVKGVFDMWSASNSSLAAEKASTASYKPASVQNSTGQDSTDAHDGVDRGAYCWDKGQNMKSLFPKYFTDTTNCTISQGATVAPFTTATSITESLTTAISTLATPTTSMPITTDMSVVDKSCPTCSAMMLAFGEGSALVLTAILAKIVYTKYRKPKRINTKVSRNRGKKMLMMAMQECLLLCASGIGVGVLVSSIKDFCGPPAEDGKQMVVISTALYLTSAATRLLRTCITSPIEEDADQEEDVEVGLSMMENLESGVNVFESTDGDDPEEPTTSKSCS